ncbi:MAG: phosphonate C-P lyase system protein PhnH [Pseudomonadota bacterium]
MSASIHAARFDAPVLHAQMVFRSALEVLSRPGSIVELPRDALASLCGLPCQPATAALLLTLTDPDTPIHLGLGGAANAVLTDWLAFHCGSPVVAEPEEAAFAVIPLDQLDTETLFACSPGEPDYPDRATTIICEADGLDLVAPETGEAPMLTGPGIRVASSLALQPDPSQFWEAMQRNRARYPLGPDVILVSGSRIAGVPRSTRVHPIDTQMVEAN